MRKQNKKKIESESEAEWETDSEEEPVKKSRKVYQQDRLGTVKNCL